MAFTIRGLFLNSSNEAVTNPLPDDTTIDSENLKDRHPRKIKPTISNCRYVFDNDPTVKGILLNTITTANNKFTIESENIKAKEYIEGKVKEWDLDNIFNKTLLKNMRDGPCFIEKAVIDKTIQVRFLAFDNDKYKMKVIRDPLSDKIVGYKQQVETSKDITDWQNKTYDELENDTEIKENNFNPDQIIYPVMFEEHGKAKSLISTILDYVDKKWTLESFMMSVAHKTGNLIGITIGNDRVSNANVPKSFIQKLIHNFRNPVNKDVVTIPDGVDVSTIGNNTLPALENYLSYMRSEIFLALQTPESLFSTTSSNRATAEVQADSTTGYAVFIEFLRFFLKKYFEKELIDAELKLKGMSDAAGTVTIEFDKTEPIKPLESLNITPGGVMGKVDELNGQIAEDQIPSDQIKKQATGVLTKLKNNIKAAMA
jgi:hypothetical protein